MGERIVENEKKYALLIDADNISPKYIGAILKEGKAFGNVSVRRIYGDWTENEKNSWKKCLLENSMTPIQQYSYTTGKNASDSAMIIDAMDILYTLQVDGFILASSDSDFTKLAVRLREAGKHVVGMGESKTPYPFVKACDQFKTLDVLFGRVIEEEAKEREGYTVQAEVVEKKAAPAGKEQGSRMNSRHEEEVRGTDPISPITDLQEIKNAIITLLNENSDEDGWMFLGEIGNMLIKLYPDFDSRNYGYGRLSHLLKDFKEFEIRRERAKDSHIQLVYVREK